MKKGTKEKDSVDPFAAALYSAPHRSQVSLLVGCPNDTRAIKKLCGPAAAYLWPDDDLTCGSTDAKLNMEATKAAAD